MDNKWASTGVFTLCVYINTCVKARWESPDKYTFVYNTHTSEQKVQGLARNEQSEAEDPVPSNIYIFCMYVYVRENIQRLPVNVRSLEVWCPIWESGGEVTNDVWGERKRNNTRICARIMAGNEGGRMS